MSKAFATVMRRMPQVMTAFAAIQYLAAVVIALRSGDRLLASFGDAAPTGYRLESFLIIFVQPLASVMIILFGAALLWRIDVWLLRVAPVQRAEAAE